MNRFRVTKKRRFWLRVALECAIRDQQALLYAHEKCNDAEGLEYKRQIRHDIRVFRKLIKELKGNG